LTQSISYIQTERQNNIDIQEYDLTLYLIDRILIQRQNISTLIVYSKTTIDKLPLVLDILTKHDFFFSYLVCTKYENKYFYIWFQYNYECLPS